MLGVLPEVQLLDPSYRPRRRADVQSRTVDGEAVLFDPRTGHAVYLNESAALIWALCDGAASIAEITELLSREIGESAPDIAADIGTTMDGFAAGGLLEPAG